jgi:hypothetical protein
VIEAMGAEEGRRFLPVKFTKDGAAAGDALAFPGKAGTSGKAHRSHAEGDRTGAYERRYFRRPIL